MIRLTFLGTGGSFGNPVLTCTCPSCLSAEPRDHRLRSSVLLEGDTGRLLVDSGLDFRQQALRAGIRHLDAVWYTHAHADHAGGVDDLRPYCFGGKVLPVLGEQRTLDEISQRFSYAFRSGADPSGVSHPLLLKTPIRSLEPTAVQDLELLPLAVPHGPFSSLGFRCNGLVYLTDVSGIPEELFPALEGVEVLVMSALREQPHPTHLSFDQAIELASRIGAKRTIFTHFAHGTLHGDLERRFPTGMESAFDGMVISA